MFLTVTNKVLRDRFGERKSLEMIKQAGFDGVDFSLYQFDDSTYMLGDDYIERAYNSKKTLDELGLICEQSHAPFSVKYGDPFDLSCKNYRDVVRALEYSSILKCKNIVVHAIICPSEVDEIRYNAEYYNSLLPYAKKFGAVICIENLHSVVNTPEKHKELFNALDSEYFAICVDVGHSLCRGYSPDEYIKGFPPNQIRCVHIQDIDGKNDNHWVPYQGVIKWDKVLKALKDYGFKGALNFEIIHCFDNIENGLITDFLTYAQKVGRFMIEKIDAL